MDLEGYKNRKFGETLEEALFDRKKECEKLFKKNNEKKWPTLHRTFVVKHIYPKDDIRNKERKTSFEIEDNDIQQVKNLPKDCYNFTIEPEIIIKYFIGKRMSRMQIRDKYPYEYIDLKKRLKEERSIWQSANIPFIRTPEGNYYPYYPPCTRLVKRDENGLLRLLFEKERLIELFKKGRMRECLEEERIRIENKELLKKFYWKDFQNIFDSEESLLILIEKGFVRLAT